MKDLNSKDMKDFISSVVDAIRRSYEFKMFRKQFNYLNDSDFIGIQIIGFPMSIRDLVIYTIKTTDNSDNMTSLQIAYIMIQKILTGEYPISILGGELGSYIYDVCYYISTENRELSAKTYAEIQKVLESSLYDGDMTQLLSFIDEVHNVIGDELDSSLYVTFLKYKNILESKSGKGSVVEIGKNIKNK